MIVDHKPACALHNAPTAPPAPCTCGATVRFKIWDYDACNDEFGWRDECRETLIARVASQQLARFYLPFREGKQGLPGSVWITRAVKCGLHEVEFGAIHNGWADLMKDVSSRNSIIAEAGHLLDDKAKISIMQFPTLAEVNAALAGWIDYWAASALKEKDSNS